jgi:small subunit ribosomal protein S3
LGQKVHPTGYRLGVSSEWESKWFAAPKEYAKKVHEDLVLRKYIEDKWKDAGISRVDIERVGHVIRFTVWTSRPGVAIGKGGSEIQVVKDELQKRSGARVMLNIQEIKNPDVVSQLVARGIAVSLERRISFRRAMKQAMFRSMKAGAKGIKVQVSGRLGGAEIARTEWYNEGRLPLSTIRADIDYGFAEAVTMYGVIGCKVWIYRDRENEHPVQQRLHRRPRGGNA